MELSDHTIVTILRVAWVIEAAACVALDRAAMALLRYLDANPSAVASGAADRLPGPESWRWLWRRAGGARVVRFAWSADANRTQDGNVRRYVLTLRAATVTIVVALVTMLLVTAGHPSRRWSIVEEGSGQMRNLRGAGGAHILADCRRIS